MKDIVVFAGSIGSTYSIVRSINRKIRPRIFVIFINERYASFLKSNKYIFEVEDWNIVSFNSFQEQVKSWYDKHSFLEKPIIYCTSDESCVLISENRRWFEDNFVLTLPNNQIILSFNNKSTSIMEAQKANIRVPLSKDIFNIDDFQYVEKFNFPVIIKPFDYKSLSVIGFKVLICDSYSSFKDQALLVLEKKIAFQCQEYIEGDDESLWFYIFYRNKNGCIVDCIGKKTLQYPEGKGVMSIGTTCDNEIVRSVSRNFLTKIDYVGIGGLEYKQKNDEYYFIEMSTRSEGFIRISDIADVSIPLISYFDMSSFLCDSNIVLKQKENRLYVDVLIYLIGIFKNKRFKRIFRIPTLLFSNRTIINAYPVSYYFFLFKQGVKRLLNMSH